MRIAQAWADLRVVLAKSHPKTPPSSTDAYIDLQNAIRDSLMSLVPHAETSAADALAADVVYEAHAQDMHELLHSVVRASYTLWVRPPK